MPVDFGNVSVPSLATVSQYPALSVGICIFTFILLLIDLACGHGLAHKVSLYPGAPFHFDLNRLSLYPLFHQGLLHWGLNMLGLFTPLAMYERVHGTVYTGITLNVLAVSAAVQYSLVGILLFPNNHVIGISGIVFSFFAYYAYKEHQLKPVIYTFKFQGREYSIQTLYSPLVALVITFFLLPGSSLFGHLAGISSGYLLAMDKLNFMYPPSKVVLFIESKLASAIKLLDGIVIYYKEEEAIEQRGVVYNPILSQDVETTDFQGQGQVLGR